jgi:hypothetical protein
LTEGRKGLEFLIFDLLQFDSGRSDGIPDACSIYDPVSGANSGTNSGAHSGTNSGAHSGANSSATTHSGSYPEAIHDPVGGAHSVTV